MVRMKLKMFRISNNLSQQEIADALGVPRQTYSMVERGQRRGSISMWSKIQETFNVSDSDMLKMHGCSEEQRKWQYDNNVSDAAMWELIKKG